MYRARGRRANQAPKKSMMSGSQNRLKRNGSTAEEESGPPNWNRTTLIFFFSVMGQSRKGIQDARLKAGATFSNDFLLAALFQAANVILQAGHPAGDGNQIDAENGPDRNVRRH